jgi:ABC-2 type transport system permease protein
MWITVNVLGDPDNGVILTSYIGSFLVAGAFLAIGSFISALTKNQVIAFIISATVCFLFVTSGMELVQNTLRVWTPRIVSDAVSSMSFLTHYSEITRGVISLDSIVFFVSIIAFSLFANAIAVGQKKSA